MDVKPEVIQEPEAFEAAILKQVNHQAHLIACNNYKQLAELNERIKNTSQSVVEAGLWGTSSVALCGTLGTLTAIATVPPDRTLREAGSTVITGSLIGTVIGSAIAISLIVSKKIFLQRNQ